MIEFEWLNRGVLFPPTNYFTAEGPEDGLLPG